MSDLIRFFFVISLGFSVSLLLYFIMCFPSFSPASRQRALRLVYYIQIPIVLIAFYVSHMFEHILHFLDLIANV